MKKGILIAIVMTASILSFAQEQQTLFGNKKGFGAFIGINSQAAEINGQPAYLAGGEFNLVFGHSLNIGVKGMGMVSNVNSNTTNTDGDLYNLQFGYGGLNFEPVIASNSVLHLTFPVLLGAGGIAETQKALWQEEFAEFGDPLDVEPHRSDLFLIAEPGVNLELNVFKFMRLTGGVSYRFLSDAQIPELETSDFQGFSGNLSLRLGWF